MELNLQTKFGNGTQSYEAAGEFEGIQRLVDRFYELMSELPEAALIRALHPDDLTTSRDKLARFLSGWMGGPRLYQERYGAINIPGVHSHLAIGAAERDAWLTCMGKAAEEQPYTPEFRAYLLEQLAVPANRIVAVSEALSAPRIGPNDAE